MKIKSHLREKLNFVKFSSVAQSCPTLCNPMNRSTPGLPVHHQLPVFTLTQVHGVGDAIQPSHPVIPFSCLQSFPESGSFQTSQFFVSGGQSTGASASVSSPFIEFSGLIFFRIDLFDLLAVQGILKSLLQHHSSKASILWRSVVFIVQLSHLYVSDHYWKNHSFD